MPQPQHSQTLERVRALGDLVRSAAAAQEADSRLAAEVIEGLRDAGVFRMAVPRQYGGDELTPAQMLAIAEELSAMDGSTGWVGTLAAGNAAIMVPRASEAALQRVFEAGPDVLIAGGPVPMARAREVEGGWAFENAYHFASGCLHADWHLVGAVIMDGDAPRMTERGPATVAGIVPADQLTITGSWDTLGLRATSSLDLDLEGLVVPEPMTFAGVPAFKPLPPLVYRYSYGYFGFMPPVSLGIARGALEAFIELAAQKRQQPVRSTLMSETEQAQELVARCRGQIDAARAHMLWAWEHILGSADESGSVPEDVAAAYHIAIVQTVDTAVDVVDRLHRAVGTVSIFDGGPLDRAFRDVHTAAQHIIVSPARYVSAGRVMMGLDPGTTMF